MSDKVAATYYDPRVYECVDCGKRWATPSAAEICCDTAWLGYD